MNSLLLALLACTTGVAISLNDTGPAATTDSTPTTTDDTDPGTTDETDTPPDDTETTGTDDGGTDSNPPADTAVEQLPDAPDPGSLDELFGDEVIEIRLTIEAEAWADLEEQSNRANSVGAEFYDFTYVEASVTYNDLEYGPIGVRIKGQGSYQPIWVKASLKLKFDLYDEDLRFLAGLNRLTLNNMSNDYSMAHERIAYRAYGTAGVPASRAGHAQVYINDELFGLYTVLETVDKDMIRARYDSDEGVLYEGWDVDFYPSYVDDFELEFGDDTYGRQQLALAANALQSGSGQVALDAADAYIDIDQFLRFWAAEAVIGQYDSYPYSSPGDDYFVYLDPADARFDFIPWGNDETFYSPDSNVTSAYGSLAAQCNRSSACQERFAEHVWEIMTLLEEEDWLAYYDGVIEQIEPHVLADTHKSYSNNTVAQYQASMRDFMEERAQKLQQWVGPRP